jgi:predicted amidohydrolase
VKIAAYQAPLLPSGSREAVDLIRTRVEWCEGLCNDSNHREPARMMASKGATALFVPTNNGLPPEKADVAVQARKVDVALAIENSVSVVRADVAGRIDGRMSYGSSGIVYSLGNVLQSAQQLAADLIVADLDVSPRKPRAMR